MRSPSFILTAMPNYVDMTTSSLLRLGGKSDSAIFQKLSEELARIGRLQPTGSSALKIQWKTDPMHTETLPGAMPYSDFDYVLYCKEELAHTAMDQALAILTDARANKVLGNKINLVRDGQRVDIVLVRETMVTKKMTDTDSGWYKQTIRIYDYQLGCGDTVQVYPSVPHSMEIGVDINPAAMQWFQEFYNTAPQYAKELMVWLRTIDIGHVDHFTLAIFVALGVSSNPVDTWQQGDLVRCFGCLASIGNFIKYVNEVNIGGLNFIFRNQQSLPPVHFLTCYQLGNAFTHFNRLVYHLTNCGFLDVNPYRHYFQTPKNVLTVDILLFIVPLLTYLIRGRKSNFVWMDFKSLGYPHYIRDERVQNAVLAAWEPIIEAVDQALTYNPACPLNLEYAVYYVLICVEFLRLSCAGKVNPRDTTLNPRRFSSFLGIRTAEVLEILCQGGQYNRLFPFNSEKFIRSVRETVNSRHARLMASYPPLNEAH